MDGGEREWRHTGHTQLSSSNRRCSAPVRAFELDHFALVAVMFLHLFHRDGVRAVDTPATDREPAAARQRARARARARATYDTSRRQHISSRWICASFACISSWQFRQVTTGAQSQHPLLTLLLRTPHLLAHGHDVLCFAIELRFLQNSAGTPISTARRFSR